MSGDRIFSVPKSEGQLWQGSAPPVGPFIGFAFDALVLCAQEIQPSAALFPGVIVIHAPNDDDPSRLPSRRELLIATSAARRVAFLVTGGNRVLVTCHLGLNRSGLVSALALRLVTGVSGRECRLHVQARRHGALRNKGFVRVLDALPSLKKGKRG